MPLKFEFKGKLPKAQKRQYLADTLPRSFAISTFDTQERNYLPDSSIKGRYTDSSVDGIITTATISREFSRAEAYSNNYTLEERDSLVSWVHENASKVFAITVQCHLEPQDLFWSMMNFCNHDFTDENLPIDDPKAFSGGRSRMPKPSAFDPDIWPEIKHFEFFHKQWVCLAPVFTSKSYEYNLRSQCILPFEKANTGPRGGSFSSVYKVIVHKDHQQRHHSCEVAIKQIIVQKSTDQYETEKAWETEARALLAINELDHPHIVKCIAAIRRGEGRYFMFPWADGDSLRDFWNTTPKPPTNARTIMQAIDQLRGLADALARLHNFRGSQSLDTSHNRDVPVIIQSTADAESQDDEEDNMDEYMSQESIRHGDLKPENILRFVEGQSDLGTFKIGDMGLAKRHVAATVERRGTSMKYGTRRYEPPETGSTLEGRSRLYDLWSMGCITFEFMIWLLYGNDALGKFYDQAEKSSVSEFQYYQNHNFNEPSGAQVHPTVTRWMDHMGSHDPEFRHGTSSAMKDLLKIVREKLLVAPLPPTRGTALAAGRGLVPPSFIGSATQYRATAIEFRKALDEIRQKRNFAHYAFTGNDRSRILLPTMDLGSLGPKVAHYYDASSRREQSAIKIGPAPSGILGQSVRADYSLPPLKLWEFSVDNEFATKTIARIGTTKFVSGPTGHAKLCNRCSRLDFWSSGFAIEEQVLTLRENARGCEFCKLLYDVCGGTDRHENSKVRFERNQSNITLTGDSFPVLSIFRSPDLQTPLAIQIGVPTLSESSSDEFFELANEWLKDCDDTHTDCRVLSEHTLPTRLIDVGTIEFPCLRLVETKSEKIDDRRYIALSHPWGDITTYTPFVTLRYDNTNAGHDIARFKNSIPYESLPATFRDAVDCTRKLNVRFLWIDSICIIQGSEGDFADEAKRMEDVYSGAFCVVATSRASSQIDGFLGSKPQRRHVTFYDTGKPFYVCQMIDRFNEDVIQGSLNQRGWVLQERALARRTMYFTENQTYYECAKGVRCETLTKMRNNMADFLGDSNFPEKAMRTRSRALKVEYFQGLYRQYSRLAFTRWEDRPVAIAGLEKRLQKAFDTQGRYGIFDDGDQANGGLFNRSLLWRREWKDRESKDGEPLEAISFPPDRNMHVPSWSWMAYKGGIDYTDPPYETAIWERTEIIPPWTRGGYREPGSNAKVALAAVARDFNLAGRKPEEVRVAYDTEKGSEGYRVQCVIVARARDTRSDLDRRYYVLLVIPSETKVNEGRRRYKRVGAGFMLGKYISLDKAGVEVDIF